MLKISANKIFSKLPKIKKKIKNVNVVLNLIINIAVNFDLKL